MATKPTIKLNDFLEELNANHIYNRNQIQIFSKFSRFGYLNLYDHSSITKEYIFFTKPDLNLFVKNSNTLNPDLAGTPFFVNAANTHFDSMRQLQMSVSDKTKDSPFCNLLSNTAKSKIDLTDISIDELETATNIYGNKIKYPLATTTSSNLQEFTLEFEDTKYLDVYMFFRIWYEYEVLKIRGLVKPDEFYILNKILHDQMSVYKITVGEDMETIIHWAKLWGVYPNTIPRGTFSDLTDDVIKFSVSFSSQWMEDMDPLILSDFNTLVSTLRTSNTKEIPIYNSNVGTANGEWCTVPYITRDTLHGRPVYKLKWGGK